MTRALFIDRDGTLVEPRHYPSRPVDLVLYPGISPSLRRLRAAGFKLVVITNQSGLARGLFTADDLDRMHDHLRAELARDGVEIDAIYFCPHHVEGVVPALTMACACRKPEPGMLHQAAADLGLDLAASWFLGDILDDVEAGNRAGCRTILVDIGTEEAPAEPSRQPTAVARDTVEALAIVAGAAGLEPAPVAYVPDRWLVAAERGSRGR
ncbi:MAG: HAD family hydrolase [Chloroflexia bacterium]|nr:HAD family hydrolase [Chloroflexia bacterium]